MTYFPQGAKNERKNILIYLLIISIFLVGCDDVKNAVSGNSLPDEGKKALEKEIDGYRTIDNFSVPSSYRVKSAKKATITHRLYDEIWCVVIDPPVYSPYGTEDHYIVIRQQLLWEANDAGYYFWGNEDDWLSLGCDNWN
ncbi:MAG: hypothetical protein HND46_09775 [Chloroflexi bacterium]|nr:hypothetical protein [Chloroflexota bacterium]NOG63698.1 hypothetical protein [Chloroflexota bacterium]